MKKEVTGNLQIEIDGNLLYLWFDGQIITSEHVRAATVTFTKGNIDTICVGSITLRRSWLSNEIIEKITESLK